MDPVLTIPKVRDDHNVVSKVRSYQPRMHGNSSFEARETISSLSGHRRWGVETTVDICWAGVSRREVSRIDKCHETRINPDAHTGGRSDKILFYLIMTGKKFEPC